jgi:hypothetical protein
MDGSLQIEHAKARASFRSLQPCDTSWNAPRGSESGSLFARLHYDVSDFETRSQPNTVVRVRPLFASSDFSRGSGRSATTGIHAED